MSGRINQLAYRFSRHFFMGWTLTRWVVTMLLLMPLVVLVSPVRRMPGGWLILLLFALFSLGGIYSLWRVRRKGYLQFEAASQPETIAPVSLQFPEKIALRVSGNLRVSKLTRYFVEERAFYQTFNTRERVIMVEMAQTRYLLLAQSAEGEVGWWYAFFTPKIVHQLTSGQVCFGPHERPAIALTYQPDGEDAPETLYFSFDSPADRAVVLANLYRDLPPTQAK